MKKKNIYSILFFRFNIAFDFLESIDDRDFESGHKGWTKSDLISKYLFFSLAK